MKAINLHLFVAVIVFLLINCFDTFGQIYPKHMQVCPAGTLQSNAAQQATGPSGTISVAAFYISHEITNREFREFTDNLRENPDSVLHWIPSFSGSGNPAKHVVPKSYADILVQAYDSAALNEFYDSTGFTNYLSDPKFNDYPVVGVTYYGASFYCIWLTQKENKARISEGMDALHDYRIPLEEEWLYAARRAGIDENPAKNRQLEAAKDASQNSGILHMHDNVSEWVTNSGSSTNSDAQIVRGGNWLEDSSSLARITLEPGKSTYYTGFRIVRSVKQE